MDDFLLGACAFVLLMVAVSLVVVLRGPGSVERMMAAMLFGTGGIALELYRDVALAAPPLDERRALALIEATRAGKLVHGYRGRPALDIKAAVAALIGLSRLMLDANGRIQSVDINPFLLRQRGGVALDGLVVLADHGA